ncbi:MAG TPA: DMT family transporter [Thermomicrobiales bacterium]|nr:DMT family transporter [Thermomicrobiales bacterium]
MTANAPGPWAVDGDTAPAGDLMRASAARPIPMPQLFAWMSPLWFGVIELTLAMATIASGILATKVVTEALPPMTASVVRYALGALLLLPFMLRKDGLPRLDRAAWGLVISVSLCGTLIFNTGLLYGLRYTSVVEAGIVTSTTPLLVGIFGFLVFRERLSGRSWGAIAIATAGIGLIIVQPGASAESGVSTLLRLAGLALIVMAASGEACFNVLGRRMPASVATLTVSTLTMAIGVLLFLPFAVVETVRDGLPPLREPAWWAVGFHAVVPTLVGLLLWSDGVRRVSLAVSSATTAMIPVFTTLFAVALLGESLGVTEVAGMVLVIIAVVTLAHWSGRRQPGLS